MTLPRSALDVARRTRAVFLCVLRHVGELPWADCWVRAHPDADLPRDAAAVTAEREVDWLREYYPLDMENKLAAHGLGFDDLIRSLTEQLLCLRCPGPKCGRVEFNMPACDLRSGQEESCES